MEQALKAVQSQVLPVPVAEPAVPVSPGQQVQEQGPLLRLDRRVEARVGTCQARVCGSVVGLPI